MRLYFRSRLPGLGIGNIYMSAKAIGEPNIAFYYQLDDFNNSYIPDTCDIDSAWKLLDGNWKWLTTYQQRYMGHGPYYWDPGDKGYSKSLIFASDSCIIRKDQENVSIYTNNLGCNSNLTLLLNQFVVDRFSGDSPSTDSLRYNLTILGDIIKLNGMVSGGVVGYEVYFVKEGADIVVVPLQAIARNKILIKDESKLIYANAQNISYYLQNSCKISLSVYNSIGRQIKLIIDGKHNHGLFSIQWNGKELSKGMYYIMLKTETNVSTKRLLVLK